MSDTENRMLADLEYKLQVAVHLDCECAPYLIRNRERLLPVMVETAERQGEDADAVVNRFVRGVHERHLAGQPLADAAKADR